MKGEKKLISRAFEKAHAFIEKRVILPIRTTCSGVGPRIPLGQNISSQSSSLRVKYTWCVTRSSFSSLCTEYPPLPPPPIFSPLQTAKIPSLAGDLPGTQEIIFSFTGPGQGILISRAGYLYSKAGYFEPKAGCFHAQVGYFYYTVKLYSSIRRLDTLTTARNGWIRLQYNKAGYRMQLHPTVGCFYPRAGCFYPKAGLDISIPRLDTSIPRLDTYIPG